MVAKCLDARLVSEWVAWAEPVFQDGENVSNKEVRIDQSQVIKQASVFDSKLGLLEFKLKQPVSLAAGKSAAIPLWEERFPTRQIGEISGVKLLSDDSYHSVESMIDLVNSHDLPLLMAPVTIFLPTLEKNSSR